MKSSAILVHLEYTRSDIKKKKMFSLDTVPYIVNVSIQVYLEMKPGHKKNKKKLWRKQ